VRGVRLVGMMATEQDRKHRRANRIVFGDEHVIESAKGGRTRQEGKIGGSRRPNEVCVCIRIDSERLSEILTAAPREGAVLEPIAGGCELG
jgi:hypothetical protein